METQQRSQPQRPDEDLAVTREERPRNPLVMWWPEIAIAVLALVLLIPTLTNSPFRNPLFDLTVALLISISAVLFRRAPGVALALVWAALALVTISVVLGLVTAMTYSFALLAITAFGAGRYGRTVVVTLGGASIVLVVALTTVIGIFVLPALLAEWEEFSLPLSPIFVPIAMSLLLGMPWLVGLLLRSQAETAESQQVAVVARTGEQQAQADRAQAHIEREQAQEIAHLRADQARMAVRSTTWWATRWPSSSPKPSPPSSCPPRAPMSTNESWPTSPRPPGSPCKTYGLCWGPPATERQRCRSPPVGWMR